MNVLIIFATVDAIPLMITLNRFADDDAVAVLMIDDVADLPFTIEVRVLADEVNVLVVLEATRFVRLVLVATPFTEVVRVVPFVEIPFEEITEVVATTPLTVVVRVLPVTD